MNHHLLSQLNNGQLSKNDFDVKNHFTDTIVNHMTQNKINFILTYIVKQLGYYPQNDIQLVTTNKHYYILNKLLSSLVISVLLGHLNIHYLNTIDTMLLYDNKENKQLSIYTIQNNITNINLINNITNVNNLMIILFQLVHALMTAQQIYQMTHYQFNYKNIMLTHYPTNINHISYPLPNTTQKIILNKVNYPYIVKIKGFKKARIENDQFVLSNKTFISWYDFASFLGSLIIDDQLRQHFNLDIYRFLLQLLSYFFNDSIDITNYNHNELDEMRNYMAFRFYETHKGKMSYKPKIDKNIYAKSMVEMVHYLGQKLIQNKLVVQQQNISFVYIIKDLSPYHLYDVHSEKDLTLSTCADSNLKLVGYTQCKNKSKLKTITIKKKC